MVDGARRLRMTLRSILVDEDTGEQCTLRAASEKGTVLSALALWWTIKRHDLLPHRWYAYERGNDDLDTPDHWGWKWRGRDFLVRHR